MQSNKKKTYVIFSAFFGWNAASGGMTVSMDVVREWLNRGHRVHVFCSKLPSYRLLDLASFEEQRQLQIHGLILPEETNQGHRLNPDLDSRVKALLHEIQPDVIHVHNFQGMLSGVDAAIRSGIQTVYLALDFGMFCLTWYLYDGQPAPCQGPEATKCRKCVVKNNQLRIQDAPHHIIGSLKRVLRLSDPGGHGPYFSRRNHQYWREAPKNIDLMLSCVKRFTNIVAPSPAVYEQALQYRGTPDGLHTFLFPVSENRIAQTSEKSFTPEDGPLRLLFLGHSHPIKGWPFMMKVLEELPKELPIQIWDAGGNQGLLQNASEKVKRFITICKRVPSQEVAALIQSSDVVLVPSLWHENSPLVVLEAHGNHRPVLASDQRGISHLIQPEINGIVLPPGNVLAWKTAITELATSPGRIRRMRTTTHYSRIASEFVDDLESLEICPSTT